MRHITEALLEENTRHQIYVLQTGMKQEYAAFPDGVRVLNIASPYCSRAAFNASRNSIMDIRIPVEAESQEVLRHAKRIKPDIFVSEFFPFGRPQLRLALAEALRHLKREGVEVICSLGYPYIHHIYLRGDEKIFSLLLRFYDLVLIHTPPHFEERYFEKAIPSRLLRARYRKLIGSLRDKLRYTGYVIPGGLSRIETPLWAAQLKAQGKHLVLVSRGGGIVGKEIISSAIEAKSILGEDFVFLICAGPASAPEEMGYFKKMLSNAQSKGIILRSFIPDLYRYFRLCDCSVSMAGYNTAAQLLYFKKKSVVIPWQRRSAKEYFNDQLARSRLLKDYLGSTVIPYADLTADKLARAIRSQLKKKAPHPDLPRSSFEGKGATARYILEG